jgi:hypothetical protein
MKKLYFLTLYFFIVLKLAAQDCSVLQFNTSVTESRCAATGSISINATGGSSNYNYRVTGPVPKSYTSSNLITGLKAGYYTVFVKDVNTGCEKQTDSVYVPGSYLDPRFQLSKVNVSCTGNDGSISAIGLQFGLSPFTYTIIAPSPSNVGSSNTTGTFNGLVAGEYYMQLKDSCGGIQVRRITIESYNWWLDSTSVVKAGCDSANAYIRVKDNRGNVNTGAGFAGFKYGVVINAGDTTWFTNHSFRFATLKKLKATLVVKDNCGNSRVWLWTLPANFTPSTGNVNLSNMGCINFTATVSGQQNLTNPEYCLFNSSNVQIACNNTGVFNNLQYGNYCIKVKDGCYDTTITRCFTATKPLPSVNANVDISNQDCFNFTAKITGQQNLKNATYCLYKSPRNVLIDCNNTGVFNDVPYGNYCIEIKSECNDTTIKKCFNIRRPVPVLTSVTTSGNSCKTFNINSNGTGLIGPTYCLYDSLGNRIRCNTTGQFDSIPLGRYCVRAITSCGDSTALVCVTGLAPKPSVGANVQISNRICSGFTATITGQQNLTNPQYCLYNSADQVVACNSNGIFTNIPYGSYCIKVKDGCQDTTITRCFSQAQAIPSVNAKLQLTSSNCNTVSFKVNGSNLTSPSYCLYDASNNQVSCNTTGQFNNLPYGSYCVKVKDGCKDTTFTVCQTFSTTNKISLVTNKNCSFGNANVSVTFASGNSPFNVNIYKPDGSLTGSYNTSSNPSWYVLPALPAGQRYRIVGTDNCGRQDTASIVPDASIVTKNTIVNKKCPSATYQNGAGDIISTCTSNWNTVSPAIIKKNGAAFNKSYSSVSGSTYTFSDMEPATYIVEYSVSYCSNKLYDTVTVDTYTYPLQGQSAVYQCDDNSFTLGADVRGGVNPYTYQIIGSVPESPSIVSNQVNNPVFTINNGTTYSLVRLRSIDHCGNATLADVSVLPLQNLSITATDSCYYRNILLSVDVIPNATYTWYRKTTIVDSTIIGTDSVYNLPFFRPEETGTYICKVSVNNGCLTRSASFELDGECGAIHLGTGMQLKGTETSGGTQLKWISPEEKNVGLYEIQRKTTDSFEKIGSVQPRNAGTTAVYYYMDAQKGNRTGQYRIKKISTNGKIEYSNIISLKSNGSTITVYPNPAKDELSISIAAGTTADYRILLMNSSGQNVFAKELRGIKETTFHYNRVKDLSKGLYFVKVINITNGKTETQKLIIE